MAFITSASTVTLTAKLTPFGRQQLLQNTNSIISHFSLGDSDANYRATDELNFGDVPASAGQMSVDGTLANSVTNGVSIKYKVLVNNQGLTMKEIENSPNKVTTTEKKIGQTIITGDTRVFTMDRTQSLTQPLTNLFTSVGLPITETQQNMYVNIIDANGGFSNTALANLNQDKVLVISIDSNKYGEMIDGRVIKIDLTVSGTPFTIYSTYQKSLTSLDVQDAKTTEISPKAKLIGDNVVFLFSDNVKKPNNDSNKSWGTGFNTVKPFSVNNKELFNLLENRPNNTVMDEAVGVIHLDKGLIVITEPSIVNNRLSGDTIAITFDSLVNEVSQDITCVVNRGEFSRSINPTYGVGEPIRISEVGLHDLNGNLMAIAKTNRHIVIGANQFLAMGIKLIV